MVVVGEINLFRVAVLMTFGCCIHCIQGKLQTRDVILFELLFYFLVQLGLF
jgi:hypothetical protein